MAIPEPISGKPRPATTRPRPAEPRSPRRPRRPTVPVPPVLPEDAVGVMDPAAVGRPAPPLVLPRPAEPAAPVAPAAAPPIVRPAPRAVPATGWPERAKRGLDVAGSLGLLVVLAPVLLVLATLVVVDSRGPVLYGARRVGRGGRAIRVLKFRSMHADAERRLAGLLRDDPACAEEFRATFKLKRDPRLTRIGSFLRRTSLDELPQLLNVLAGDMSLVGPRPIVAGELDLYRAVDGAAEAYLACRPGITGLWQVSGRNDVSYRHRVMLDRFYGTHRGLRLDLWIMVRTPAAVLRGDGAY